MCEQELMGRYTVCKTVKKITSGLLMSELCPDSESDEGITKMTPEDRQMLMEVLSRC